MERGQGADSQPSSVREFLSAGCPQPLPRWLQMILRDRPTPIRRLVPVTPAGYLEHEVKVSKTERLIPRPVWRSLHRLVHPSPYHLHSQLSLHVTSDLHYKKEGGKKEGNRRYAWTLRPVWMKRQQTVQVKGENGGNGRWGSVLGRVLVEGFCFRALIKDLFFSLTCTTVTPGLEFHIHTVQRQI